MFNIVTSWCKHCNDSHGSINKNIHDLFVSQDTYNVGAMYTRKKEKGVMTHQQCRARFFWGDITLAHSIKTPERSSLRLLLSGVSHSLNFQNPHLDMFKYRGEVERPRLVCHSLSRHSWQRKLAPHTGTQVFAVETPSTSHFMTR